MNHPHGYRESQFILFRKLGKSLLSFLFPFEFVSLLHYENPVTRDVANNDLSGP